MFLSKREIDTRHERMELSRDMENVPQTQYDTGMAKAKPVKLGWSTEEIDHIVKVLNALLANYAVHYQKLRSYHWNVKGADFFDLHAEFDRQYHQAEKNIDQLAERVRIFGKTPLSTMQEYLEASEIKETGTDLTSELMVREILNDYYILLDYMFRVVDVAVDQGDSGTEHVVKKFISDMERDHWMFTSYLAT